MCYPCGHVVYVGAHTDKREPPTLRAGGVSYMSVAYAAASSVLVSVDAAGLAGTL